MEEDSTSLLNQNSLEIKEDVFSAFLNSNAYHTFADFGK